MCTHAGAYPVSYKRKSRKTHLTTRCSSKNNNCNVWKAIVQNSDVAGGKCI